MSSVEDIMAMGATHVVETFAFETFLNDRPNSMAPLDMLCMLKDYANRVDGTVQEFKTVIQTVYELDKLTLSSRKEKPEASRIKKPESSRLRSEESEEEEGSDKEPASRPDGKTGVAPRPTPGLARQGSVTGSVPQPGRIQPARVHLGSS